MQMLKSLGLREDDPRLKPMMTKIKEIETEREKESQEIVDPGHWNLDKAQFKRYHPI